MSQVRSGVLLGVVALADRGSALAARERRKWLIRGTTPELPVT